MAETKNQKTPAAAADLAREMGYSATEYVGAWKGYSVYHAYDPDETGCVGYPCFILFRDGSARAASIDETMECTGL